MRTPLRSSLVVLAAAALCGCNSVESGDDDNDPAAPEVQALFGSLQPATPDWLRGVWSITTGNAQGDADLRMRFEDGNIMLGTRCVAKAAPNQPVLVGSSTAIATTDLDGKTGVPSDLSETINVTEAKNGVSCSGRFDKATWKFVITGTALDMDPVGLQGHVHLDKVGD